MDETEEISELGLSDFRIELRCKFGKFSVNDFRYESCIDWVIRVVTHHCNIQARITSAKGFRFQKIDLIHEHLTLLRCYFNHGLLRLWLRGLLGRRLLPGRGLCQEFGNLLGPELK